MHYASTNRRRLSVPAAMRETGRAPYQIEQCASVKRTPGRVSMQPKLIICDANDRLE